MTRPPARCNGCQVNRVAWVRPRVDFCYECLPGGPFSAPACRKCASGRYFSEGLCDRCHPGAPLHLGSCRDCLAWGVFKANRFRCWSCNWWNTHYPLGDCEHCTRNTRIGDAQACRLCIEQARMLQEPGRAPDLAAANQYGQQLFFANMRFQRLKTPRLKPEGRRSRRPPKGFRPLTWRQEVLFHMEPDSAVVLKRAFDADSDLVRHCSVVVRDHAARHGWSTRQTNDVIRSLRLLQVLHDTPGAKIRASEVAQLPRYGGNVASTIDVLAVPLPLDTTAIRQALDSPDPAVALAVALVAFHALTDIVDGRLFLDSRDIPLAGPVKVRLAAWLDHRARTWPATINTHLFINNNSGPRLTPIGKQFPWKNTSLRPQALREDRILQEIHATGGDFRKICDLFGITIGAAMRYAPSHPDLEHPSTRASNLVDSVPSRTVD